MLRRYTSSSDSKQTALHTNCSKRPKKKEAAFRTFSADASARLTIFDHFRKNSCHNTFQRFIHIFQQHGYIRTTPQVFGNIESVGGTTGSSIRCYSWFVLRGISISDWA